MGKRTKKVKKPPPELPRLRSKEERQHEVRNVINKLTELNLTINFDPVMQLMTIMQDYINYGNEHIINIPFMCINKDIVGKLTRYINEPVYVKLKSKE